MKALDISVAMCTYNGSRYVGEQLQSIASQTLLPCELVVCDDRSTDDTVCLLTAFASKAPFPVRLFLNDDRLGPAKNFEKAIQLCEGAIIALADQDDVWRPNKLAKFAEVLSQQPENVYAFSDAEMVDGDGASLGYKLWDTIGFRKELGHFAGPGQLRILLRRNVITGAAMAFRSSFRETILPIPTGWMHDYWIVSLGSALFGGIPIPEILIDYRRHASQAVGWKGKTFLQVCRISLATRRQDSWKKLQQFRELQERLLSVPGFLERRPEYACLIEEKEAHLLKRATIRSTKGLSRILKVVLEASTGRYRRFSNSWHSIVRDL